MLYWLSEGGLLPLGRRGAVDRMASAPLVADRQAPAGYGFLQTRTQAMWDPVQRVIRCRRSGFLHWQDRADVPPRHRQVGQVAAGRAARLQLAV